MTQEPKLRIGKFRVGYDPAIPGESPACLVITIDTGEITEAVAQMSGYHAEIVYSLLLSDRAETVRVLREGMTLKEPCPEHRDDCTCYEIALKSFDRTAEGLMDGPPANRPCCEHKACCQAKG